MNRSIQLLKAKNKNHYKDVEDLILYLLNVDKKIHPTKLSPREIEKVGIIQQEVSDYFKVPVHALKIETRITEFVKPRHIAMYLVHRWLGIGQKTTAKLFNRKNHTSVLHAAGKVDGFIDNEKGYKEEIAEIKNKLRIKFEELVIAA